jgi:hydrogenase maturation factor HypF (carbamoyltransferase family)
MKIVFGTSLDAVATHAKFLVRQSQQKRNEPIGIASYAAKVPEVCEDCGQTYWHGGDPYQFYPHLGCSKSGKGLGFN